MAALNKDCSDLKPEWSYVGVGRDDGKAAGEYSPIIYRTSVWRLKNSATIWLSPTPDVPSKGWDAGSIRILTIGYFRHKQTGAQVVAMNTHLDNVGTVSRENSARIITEEIRRCLDISAAQGHPPALFLAGDLNSTPEQEAYLYLTQPSSQVYDAKDDVDFEEQYGNRLSTFTDFVDGHPDELLDHVFLDNGSAWTAKTYAILANRFDDGIIYSDHRPVVVDAELSLHREEADGWDV